MPRNMSFYHTQQQIRDRTKTVTRRKGWGDLKPGERFWAIVKGQGLKKGEKVERIVLLECVRIRTECLDNIQPADVAREGFPGMTPREFVEMFCRNMGGHSVQIVNRIEFKYVETGP